MLVCCIHSGVPIFTFSYRLVLISDFEKQKLEFALKWRNENKLGGGGGMGGHTDPAALQSLYQTHRDSRLIAISLLGLTPPFVLVPIFLRFDTSWDWDADVAHCSFRNFAYIPILISSIYLSTCALIVVYQIKSRNIQDAWSIRKSLQQLLMYGNLCFLGFLMVNGFWGDVNATGFNTGHLLTVESWATIFHLVGLPIIKSFYLSQYHLLAPEERKFVLKIDTAAAMEKSVSAAPSPAGLGTGGANGSPVNALAVGGGGGGGGGEVSRRAPSYTMHSSRRSIHFGLHKVLGDARGYRLFLAYCSTEFASENVLFYTAVDEYRAAPSIAGCEQIWRSYVAPHARLQVNLSHATVDSLRQQLTALGVSLGPRPQSKPPTPVLGASPSYNAALAVPPTKGLQQNPSNSGSESTPKPGAAPGTIAVAASASAAAAKAPSPGGGPAAADIKESDGVVKATPKSESARPPPIAGGEVGLTPVLRPALRPSLMQHNSTPPQPLAPGPTDSELLARVFDDAQKETYGLLECDSFSRFVHTQSGRDCQALWDPNFAVSPTGEAAAAGGAAGRSSRVAGVAPDTPTRAAAFHAFQGGPTTTTSAGAAAAGGRTPLVVNPKPIAPPSPIVLAAPVVKS